jgi:hypothetical protein
MIDPKCDVVDCGEPLNEFGAIVLSPPDPQGMVRKFHVCVSCYEKMELNLFDTRSNIVDK